MHPAALDSEVLAKECTMTAVRRQGPGGQHRNKVSSAIVLCHEPTGLTAEANERRNQSENRRVALFRLRLQLAIHVRIARGEAIPSQLWQERVRGQQLMVSETHSDLPSLLAEALDVIAEKDWYLPSAAEALGVSASQLLRLLKKHAPAMECLNQQRAQRGLKPLQ